MDKHTEEVNESLRKGSLILADGTRFPGILFGSMHQTSGEVVFNTAMTGYPESLTDPSYEGQILVTTYPLLGNYGVPAQDTFPDDILNSQFESRHIHCRAIVAQDYSWAASHWRSARTLHEWLADEGIPGMYGIDTRALTKHLRSQGSMLGKIVPEGVDADSVPLYDPDAENLIAKVSTRTVRQFKCGQPDAKQVVLVDCGTKYNIIRCLVRRGVDVTMVPWDYPFASMEYDGLFVSNGPGNPDYAEATALELRKAMESGKPICGICMGNQLLGKAAGAPVYKLKYGHRSHNQPVRMIGTERCFITSQNHGFALDQDKLPDDWEPLFINMNDGTNEGIRHRTKPFFSAQFHPEASSGPTDTEFIFDKFIETL